MIHNVNYDIQEKEAATKQTERLSDVNEAS